MKPYRVDRDSWCYECFSCLECCRYGNDCEGNEDNIKDYEEGLYD